jgi:predicted transcriptional regulator
VASYYIVWQVMWLFSVSDFGVRQNRNKNRHGLEIARDLLSAATDRTKKTRMMYSARLSYRIMEKYLKSLLEKGLLEPVDGSSYLITRKGKIFLQMYADYLERCRRIGKEIREVQNDRVLLKNMCFSNELDSKRIKIQKSLCDNEAE